MSMTSASTTPERHSLQHYPKHDEPEIPTKVVEGDEDAEDVEEIHRSEVSTKYSNDVRQNGSTRVTVLSRTR